MTDMTREPVEVVELRLPKCINTYGVSPCTASGAVGTECYNTRATCQAVTAYRDTPDRHLTPSFMFTSGDEINSIYINRVAGFFASFAVNFAAVPSGVIWEQGGTTSGAWLGVNGTNLIFRAGNGTVTSGPNTGRLVIPVAPYVGKSVTIYCEIKFVASGACGIDLWIFDPVELTLQRIGPSATYTDNVGDWAGTDSGGIGVAFGAVPVGTTSTPWNGGDITARIYNNQIAPLPMPTDFNTKTYLYNGDKGKPADDVYMLPCLGSTSTTATKINLSGADDNYEPLGRRATFDFTCGDFTHSGNGQDPYLATRLADPRSKSTFWRKWMQRQLYGKTGALVRRYTGYNGEFLSAFQQQTFVLDSAQYSEEVISFACRDVLTRTEFLKAQVPAPTSGVLYQAMDAISGPVRVLGDVRYQYPPTGTIRINDELMVYGGRNYGANVTTFHTITRATDGSTATTHAVGDLVQLCRRYTNASVADALKEWTITDAGIPAQLVDVAGIEAEDVAYLSAYHLNTVIAEPTGVSKLIGQLSQECSFYVWWDERVQKVRMQAIHAATIADIAMQINYDKNIVAGSFKLEEKPKQRLNVVTMYYNPINFAGEFNRPANFKSALQVINGTTSMPEQYGNFLQTKEIFSRFLTSEAQANQTSSRLSVRYADVPQFGEFYLDAKDKSLWVGHKIELTHPLRVDANGDEVTKRWLVIGAEEVDPGHLIRYEIADITLDGLQYKVTANGIGTYTAALFATRNMFITDNDGLNSDGTKGATIA